MKRERKLGNIEINEERKKVRDYRDKGREKERNKKYIMYKVFHYTIGHESHNAGI